MHYFGIVVLEKGKCAEDAEQKATEVLKRYLESTPAPPHAEVCPSCQLNHRGLTDEQEETCAEGRRWQARWQAFISVLDKGLEAHEVRRRWLILESQRADRLRETVRSWLQADPQCPTCHGDLIVQTDDNHLAGTMDSYWLADLGFWDHWCAGAPEDVFLVGTSGISPKLSVASSHESPDGDAELDDGKEEESRIEHELTSRPVVTSVRSCRDFFDHSERQPVVVVDGAGTWHDVFDVRAKGPSARRVQQILGAHEDDLLAIGFECHT